MRRFVPPKSTPIEKELIYCKSPNQTDGKFVIVPRTAIENKTKGLQGAAPESSLFAIYTKKQEVETIPCAGQNGQGQVHVRVSASHFLYPFCSWVGLQPQEWRSTSRVSSLTCSCRFFPERCLPFLAGRSCSKRISAAMRPRSSIGCWITLIEGRSVAASSKSSKPRSAMVLGMATFSFCSVSKA